MRVIASNPIRHTKEGWYWGSVGPQPTKELLLGQIRAVYAGGYRGRNPVGKQSWQMTQEEWINLGLPPVGTYLTPAQATTWTLRLKNRNKHKLLVEQALSDGKPVPVEVLKDYPEFTKNKGDNPIEPRICPHCGAKIYTSGNVLLSCPVCDKSIDKPGDWRLGWPKGGKRNPNNSTYLLHRWREYTDNDIKNRISVAKSLIESGGGFTPIPTLFKDISEMETVLKLRKLKNPTEIDKVKKMLGVGKNPKHDKSLSVYEDFHKAEPMNVRKVQVDIPEGTLVALGRLKSLVYEPEGSSKYNKVSFNHDFGDTGSKKFESNSILCTDSEGKGLFIVRDDSKKKRPFFSDRGIIG